MVSLILMYLLDSTGSENVPFSEFHGHGKEPSVSIINREVMFYSSQESLFRDLSVIWLG